MKKLVLLACGLTLVVVVLGAYTRLVDAGLGCPDWPGCYGHLLVPQTAEEIQSAEALFPDAPVESAKAWTEMVHRYVATALGLLILVIAALAIRGRGSGPLKLPIALALLVMLQGAFGAWTVTLKLWPQVVTAHLLCGFATLALLWLLALRLGLGSGWLLQARHVRLAQFALVVLVAQIALGGWVTSNYAALACPDFPICHGAWVPTANWAQGFDIFQSVGPNYPGGIMASEARIAIPLAHRLGAVAAWLAVGWLVWRLWAARSPLGAWLLGLLVMQLSLGIANVLLVLPLWVAVCHNAGGALLLLAVVTVNYRAFRGTAA